MLGGKETGHYQSAFNKALLIFKELDPEEMAARSGAAYDPRTCLFTLPSFGQNITIQYPRGLVTFTSSELPLLGWRLVVLNYLVRSDGISMDNRLISYRELENGTVFYNAFQRESILTLGQWVQDKSPCILAQAMIRLGAAVTSKDADLAATLLALPRFPITIKIWFPDDELPGSANILFDSSANHYLHTEDIAVLGDYASAFLINEYQVLTGRPCRPITL